MWLERQSGATLDLVSLDEARDHLRIIGGDHDADIQQAIAAASAFLDVDEDGFGGLGFPMVAQHWSVKASGFTPKLLRLPFPRISSVDEMRYLPMVGGVQVVPSEHYVVRRAGRLSQVALLPSFECPPLADRPDAVEVRFTAGWADVASVPTDIKQAAKLLMAHFFENRQAEIEGAITSELQLGVDRLTARYRRFAV
ncbi:phage gp6-like head-tail connector protein [Tropicibacter sp. R16_0]|uniref:head-tail connector protein n=1 Tax=Tropicibacter sp. R16_0 TaxID=2821102 RepID=UPI001ADAD3B7|nr:head-tail connector protein [Tropicibacter sp. R16_0]MBO9453260.1 phage gp6-like head-tail connector protein [Tropicibacter sp. R16_0]